MPASSIIIALASCLLMGAIAVPVATENDHVVHVDLLAESSTGPRARRSTDLPEDLTFGLPLNGEKVVLRLKRSALLPTVTSDRISKREAHRFTEDSAVYTDQARGSAMIVKRASGDYNLEGTFLHENAEWNLEPLGRVKRNVGENKTRSHRLFQQRAKDVKVSFVGDTVIDPIERPEVVQSHPHRNNTRHRRAVVQHVIEIAFVCDYEDYSHWVSYYPTNTIQEMRLWYTYVAEVINIRYQSISDPDIAVSTRVTILKILTNPDDDAFIENLTNNKQFVGTSGLNALSTWYPGQGDIPLSDHIMLFTGFDIIGASGIAFSARTCTKVGVSITENSFNGIVGGVAAHELGHSLSASHDADTGSVCSDNDQYIMATVFRTPVAAAKEGNPWRFSACSIQAIKTYLGGITCTLPENTGTTDVLPAPPAGQRAGEVLSRDDQCRQNFRNSDSFYCDQVQTSNGGEASLCGGMFCSIPTDRDGFCQTMVPQEYTTCGRNNWCVAGKCVTIPTSTTSTSTPTTTSQATTITVVTTTTTLPTTTTTLPTTTTTLPTTTTTLPTTTTTQPTTTTTQQTTTTTQPTTTITQPTTITTQPTTATTQPTTATTQPTTTTTQPTTATTQPTTTITQPTATTTQPTTATTQPTATTTQPTTATTQPTATTTQPTTATTQPTTTTTQRTTTTTQPTTATTQTTRPSTQTTATTRVPTTTITTPTTATPRSPTTNRTPTTSRVPSTTPKYYGPTNLQECTKFIYTRDARRWLKCVSLVLQYLQVQARKLPSGERRREEERLAEERRRMVWFWRYYGSVHRRGDK